MKVCSKKGWEGGREESTASGPGLTVVPASWPPGCLSTAPNPKILQLRPSLPVASDSYRTLPFQPHRLLVLFLPLLSLPFLLLPPTTHPFTWPSLLCWPFSVCYFFSWLSTPPDASGCTRPHIYIKNLPLHHTLEWSWPEN